MHAVEREAGLNRLADYNPLWPRAFSEAAARIQAAVGPLARLTDPAELALIKLMAGWPRLIETAAETGQRQRV